MRAGEVACSHCGLPTPADPGPTDETLAFCCGGCRVAYELLHSCGLDRYYSLRDQLGDDQVASPVASLTSDAAYAHYDDPEFLADHGYEAGRAVLHVSGLHCAACVWVIDRLPAVLDGVVSARVNLGTARLYLEWDPDRVKLSAIGGFLHQLGYPTHAADAQAEKARRDDRRRDLIRLAVAGACAGNVMLLSFALYAGAFGAFERFFELGSLLLALPVVTYAAWPFYRGALSGLRVGRLHMDLPITLGIAGGFLASAYAGLSGRGDVYFDSVTVLVFLLLIGRFVQQRGQAWALSGSALLHLLLPGTARRWNGSAFEPVPATKLRPSDRVLVHPGEPFPADGRILKGSTSIDLASLTGESRPVRRTVEGEVFAGTTNLESPVEVAVEKAGETTRVGGLVARIEAAQRERAPIVALADRIAGWFVAAVLALALVGGVAWWLHDPSRVFDVVVALLVVSCPCALGLATPSALAIARARAARRGILLRSPAALERLGHVDELVLDKTGTLTHGRMQVGWATGMDPALYGAIAAIEARARHPIAEALRRWALGEAGHSSGLRPEDVQVLPGRGVEALVDGQRLRIGSPAWLQGDPGAIERALDAGMTPVVVEVEGRPPGLIAVGDTLREDAASAVSGLSDRGFGLRVCSGDHPRVVEKIAGRIGIENAQGSMSPEDKAETLAGLERAAMIGDGINDAPALSAATVGIAVGGGAEAALKVADVYLNRPGLTPVVEALDGARRTLALVRRNLVFSLLYNLCFASLALAGLISPLVAAIIMPISSLTVLASSMLGRTFSDAGSAVVEQRMEPAGPGDHEVQIPVGVEIRAR